MRHAVTDEEWALLAPLLPARTATTGRPPSDPRLMLNGVLWVLRTGSPWRDLPAPYGPWQTVSTHFRAWRAAGAYDRVLAALHIRLDREGRIDWDLWCLDGSSVRATRAAAGATKKVSGVIRTNPATTRWAARAADSRANSTWSRTVAACR